MLRPPCYELLLCVFGFGSDARYSFAKKLVGAGPEWLGVGYTCSKRDEAFDQWLQISSLWAPNIRSLSFYFIYWIVCKESTVGKCASTNANRVKESRSS